MTAGRFEHTARVYDDEATLASELAPALRADLAAGVPVLLCAREPVLGALAPLLPTDDDRLELMPAQRRYSRPVDALEVLWRFSERMDAAGAPEVHSVGEIVFADDAADDDWYWYEAGCNEVLADRPIRATCLYGAHRCSARTLAMACHTHPTVEPAGALAPDGVGAEAPAAPIPPELPARAADYSVAGLATSRPVREALAGLGLPEPVRERACLVFSELVTNAVRHGGGAADVELWVDGDAVRGRVTDSGAGIVDPYATLRLPGRQEHGVGLWLSGHEATRLVVGPGGDGGTVATALVD